MNYYLKHTFCLVSCLDSNVYYLGYYAILVFGEARWFTTSYNYYVSLTYFTYGIGGMYIN